MLRSPKRIRTTHTGSLPRPVDLANLVRQEKLNGNSASERILANAVRDTVAMQHAAGIDTVSDGEFGKESFMTYVHTRFSGYEPVKPPTIKRPFANTRESIAFPEFYAANEPPPPPPGAPIPASRIARTCVAPLKYVGQKQLERDIDNLKTAMSASGVDEGFMPSISPSCVEDWFQNDYYKTEEEYLYAVAEALREAYLGIVNSGLMLQIDDPHLASIMLWRLDWSVEDARRWAKVRVEALNHALRGIPEDRIRHHTCHSVDAAPRTTDMELRDVLDLVLSVKAGAYSFEGANPRHEHEFILWDEFKLPEGKSIIPGVVTNSSFVVEHPELVAQRIVRYAERVGPENVVAGVDYGFGTFVSPVGYDMRIINAKFEALARGAEIASRQLWR
ncbi:MAG: epoxyalkane--coenzyme M transferase [Burkholderiales bacterium]